MPSKSDVPTIRVCSQKHIESWHDLTAVMLEYENRGPLAACLGLLGSCRLGLRLGRCTPRSMKILFFSVEYSRDVFIV